MLKRISSDWSLLFLLIFNGYLIWYYQENPASFKTLVWLYWIQSVMLGLFSALDIFLVKNPKPGRLIVNGKEVKDKSYSSGCLGFFFLFHYGMFHLVYAVFLLVQIRGPLYGNVLMLGVGLIFIDLILAFIKKRIAAHEKGMENTGKMFFLPYLRIIPMHLMILGPAFLGWSNITIFLWLKTIVDVLMHIMLSKSLQPKSITAIS